MKKKIIIAMGSVVLLVVCVLLVKHFFFNESVVEDGDPIVEIQFPQAAGGGSRDVVFEFKDNYDIKNEEILNTSYTTNNNDIDKKVKKIRSKYNVSKEEQDMRDIVMIGEGGKTITKFGDNAIDFQNDVRAEGEISVNDEECREIAEKLLKKLDLLPEGMEYGGIGEEVQTDLQTNEETVLAKTVYFYRELDGVSVSGKSSVSVTIVGSGDVKSIYYACGEISKKHEIDDENIISLEEAIEACKNFEGQVVIPDEADTVKVESVEVVYWEDSTPGSENKAIQPVYKFTGTAYIDGESCGEFFAYQSALKE
ncbi:MAG: hypothetical protein J6L69_04515 [Lachnospiraceae bacterium]|nr:hypothetical protein [Lachnospiraceae bacterium]